MSDLVDPSPTHPELPSWLFSGQFRIDPDSGNRSIIPPCAATKIGEEEEEEARARAPSPPSTFQKSPEIKRPRNSKKRKRVKEKEKAGSFTVRAI